MPRPLKQGLDYFPIDVNFFQNKKVKNLRREKGAIGVLTYFDLLCKIFENGYYFRFDDIRELSMDIAEDIASEQLRATSSRVTEAINYLVERGILDEGLFEQGIISGEAMQEQYVLATKAAKRKPKMDVHLLVDVDAVIQKNAVSSEETGVNSEETGVNSEFSTQSKVKENKNKSSSFTTTTTARAQEREEDMSAPTVVAVFAYFKEEHALDDAPHEADLFCAYNQQRGWDCLPNWKAAADLWVARMEEH